MEPLFVSGEWESVRQEASVASLTLLSQFVSERTEGCKVYGHSVKAKTFLNAIQKC
jgi:hypothetical protein